MKEVFNFENTVDIVVFELMFKAFVCVPYIVFFGQFYVMAPQET